MCTKYTWRGRYKRIIGINAVSIVTCNPDNLSVTNTFRFGAGSNSDIEAIIIGKLLDNGELEFTLSARQDDKVRF